MATTKKKTTSPSYLGDYASGNYTPSYDYVSGYYNQNAGYQNPSVYGYRGSRYNIPTNSGFSIPMKDNDPYWNLGAMLGGLWGAQYNKRGAERAGEEANAMLQDEYNRLMGVETPKQPTANDQMYDMAQKAGAIPERQAQIQMPGQEQTPKAEDLSKGLKYTDQQGNIVGPQQPDYKGEKLSYLDKKYGLINGQQHDNPEGDKKVADKTSQAVGTDISNIDVTKLPQGFNSDLLRANIVSKLKAAGRNEWQIAQAMQGIEPQILGKQREYNTQQFNNLYGMYDSLTKAGRIDEAGMVLDKMKQFNPEGAAMLTKNFDRLANYQSKKDNLADSIKFLKENIPNITDDEINQYISNGLLGAVGGKGGRLSTTGSIGNRKNDAVSYGDGEWGGYTSKQRSDAMATLKAFGYQGGDINAITDPYARKAIADAMRVIANIPPGQQGGVQVTKQSNQPSNVPNKLDWNNMDYNQVHDFADATLRRFNGNYGSKEVFDLADELESKGTTDAISVANEFRAYANQLKEAENQRAKEKYQADYGKGGTILGWNYNSAGKNIAGNSGLSVEDIEEKYK